MKGFMSDLLPTKSNEQKRYDLFQVFGCPEVPPPDCPTYLTRTVHKRFEYAIRAKNIIVVYGESKQGKTWMIERYCPKQLRIGCAADSTVDQIKMQMLEKVGVTLYPIEKKEINQVSAQGSASAMAGEEKKDHFGFSMSGQAGHVEEETKTIPPINISDNSKVLETISKRIGDCCFVFDNFHYLSPNVQQKFCTLLKDCNYFQIKIIIVGIWKDAARITALAPDLGNRCEHIDVGNWSVEELSKVASDGENALNIWIDDDAKERYIAYSSENIGIFKDFLSKYCDRFLVYETQYPKRRLKDDKITDEVAREVIQELLQPLQNRIINLAKPQRKKKRYKAMRLKIVAAILSLICDTDSDHTRRGIPLDSIQEKMDKLCSEWDVAHIPYSNLNQELGVLHEREENKETEQNFIPLFFFDKINKKLLVLEPALYVIKAYDVNLLQDIIKELKTYLNTGN